MCIPLHIFDIKPFDSLSPVLLLSFIPFNRKLDIHYGIYYAAILHISNSMVFFLYAAIFVRTNTRHFEASNKQANYRSQQFYREIIIDISHFEIIQNRLELEMGTVIRISLMRYLWREVKEKFRDEVIVCVSQTSGCLLT